MRRGRREPAPRRRNQPADEDALGYLVEALEREGRGAEALGVCRRAGRALFERLPERRARRATEASIGRPGEFRYRLFTDSQRITSSLGRKAPSGPSIL
ncbi:hypothetical protein DFR50_108129 [Roseiarcus fermentans]|uniref:Uncharacterized protein n=1 Tax=Roseiarcus fermentans TaxID=1473586 RepID=A0A366FLN6_9HYPH|nr:hypothetical protein DFR50_108129 [Roseiarcus fermentans]